MQARLRKVGGSVMLAVPPAYLDALHLESGSVVGMEIEQGRLIVQARPRRRYVLADLLAQFDPEIAETAEDRDWTEGGPVGRELL